MQAKTAGATFCWSSTHDLDYGTQSIAYAIGQGQLAYYRLLNNRAKSRRISTARELDAHRERWQQQGNTQTPIGMILAMEGADLIVDSSQESWFAEGLRSVMLSHYGKSHYSVGTATMATHVAESNSSRNLNVSA